MPEICTKIGLLLHCGSLIFVLSLKQEVEAMNITEYIKNNEKLSALDFMTVYIAITEFINDNV